MEETEKRKRDKLSGARMVRRTRRVESRWVVGMGGWVWRVGE